MRVKALIIILGIFFVNISNAMTIRVAVLNNPLAKWTSEKYTQYYLNGLNLASNEAMKLGVNYEIRVFSYKRPAINIFKAIKDIKKWGPDVVIGPCASEQFLLLKDQFKDVLVVSPYASATDVYKLPNNFYTIAVPSEFSGRQTFKFIQTFKPKHVYIFTDSECKACEDFQDALQKISTKNNVQTIKVNFINNNLVLNQLNYQNILKNYNPYSDIVVLNCTGYGASILIANISNTVKKPVVYIGGDSWGTYKDWAVAKIGTTYQYRALRVAPKLININNFTNLYIKQYKEDPDDISYATYDLLVSITDSLQRYNCNLANNAENVLCSYKNAVLKNPNWYRSRVHEVYQINKTNEVFITDVN